MTNEHKLKMRVADMILDLIGDAGLDGIAQGDLQAMTEAKAGDIVRVCLNGR
jgi:hypothetical protein